MYVAICMVSLYIYVYILSPNYCVFCYTHRHTHVQCGAQTLKTYMLDFHVVQSYFNTVSTIAYALCFHVIRFPVLVVTVCVVFFVVDYKT